MNRTEAEAVVREAYLRALGRNPLPQGAYDAGAYDYVIDHMSGLVTAQKVEDELRNSTEAMERADRTVCWLYLEMLGRDPGPKEDGGFPWADEAALDYVADFRLGVKTASQIRAELEASPEGQSRKQTRASRPEVLDNVILDTETGRRDLEQGVSLFYAMSPDTSDEELAEVGNELAAAGIRQVRFAGSTFTWDNAPKKANVIPFREGSTYVHGEGIDRGLGVDPVLDPAHLARLSSRLNFLASRGIRVQYTIFWGGMQPLFTREGRDVLWGRVEPYLEDISRFFAQHPEHTLEIINEADHGHHLARLGEAGREEFLLRCARNIRAFHPNAVITASDGGRVPKEEGDPYFAYAEVEELDYWNVHYPRDPILSEGIPRWCRGSFHLYGDRANWRSLHGKGGYGRSDENIFLTTEEEFQTWSYRGSTRDWEMYGTMIWVNTMAGVATTLHTFKGFFCEPGLTKDPIFRVVRAWNEITKGFPWQGASSYNTGWARSPVKSFVGPFKAFSLVSGENGRDILVTVLNPREGRLTMEMDRPRTARFFEITGEALDRVELQAGETRVALPPAAYERALVMRLNG